MLNVCNERENCTICARSVAATYYFCSSSSTPRPSSVKEGDRTGYVLELHALMRSWIEAHTSILPVEVETSTSMRSAAAEFSPGLTYSV